MPDSYPLSSPRGVDIRQRSMIDIQEMRIKPTVPKHPTAFSPAPSNTTASPPLSPNPYDASSEDESVIDSSVETDAQRDMDESFLLVRREDDELSTSSTIGTSLRDSMIAELSDTSAGSVSGGSFADDIPDPFEADDESAVDEEASMIEGSYTEAEVRTESQLADSRSTLQESSIKLIFPDPVASFTSSAGASSDSTTPNGSLANLIRPKQLSRADTVRLNAERIDRLTRGTIARGVDECWLEAARMWTDSPEVEKMMDDLRPYQRLGSTGDGSTGDIANFSPAPFAFAPVRSDMEMSMDFGTVRQAQGEWRKVTPPPSPSPTPKKALERLAAAKVQRNQDARRALLQITSATLGSLGKKWGIVAIASMLSLALLGTVGPNAAFSLKAKQTTSVPSMPAVNESSSSNLITQIVPDLLSIKQAISSFSTATQKALVPDVVTTKEASLSVVEQTPGKRRRRSPMQSTDRSVSVRNQDVALTVRSTPVKSLSIIPRVLRDRLGGFENSSDLKPNVTHVSADPIDIQPMKRLSDALFMAKNYSLSAYHHMDLIYGPVLAALERELGELYRLARKLIKMSSAASGPALESASKALLRAQKSLDKVSRKLYNRLRTAPPELNREAATQAIDRAQAGLHLFTEYVEGQAAAIQEQSAILLAAAQEKSLESLKQARKGLDRLIDMLGGENSVKLNVERDGPMPFDKMTGGCSKCRREGRERNRRRRHVEPKRSKWNRLQEAIHHAVVQVVL